MATTKKSTPEKENQTTTQPAKKRTPRKKTVLKKEEVKETTAETGASEQAQKTDMQQAAKKPRINLSPIAKKVLIGVGVALVALLTIFLWKQSQIRGLKTAFAEERQDIQSFVDYEIDSLSRGHIYLTMKTFGWAIRSEMLRDNFDQANQFSTLFVKEKNVKNVTVCDPAGKIIISSDKNMEDSRLQEHFPQLSPTDDQLKILPVNDQYLCAAPLMGLDNRLGTLVVTFSKDTLVIR